MGNPIKKASVLFLDLVDLVALYLGVGGIVWIFVGDFENDDQQGRPASGWNDMQNAAWTALVILW